MLNHRGLILNSSEGSSARKRLVVNVNCQSHRTLRSQDRADLHNWRCSDQNLPMLTLIQRQSQAALSRATTTVPSGAPTLLGYTSTRADAPQLASAHELPFPRRGIDE